MAAQWEIDQAKQIGSQGGFVKTDGMTSADKQAIDKAVNDGRYGR